MATGSAATQRSISPGSISKNPNNPRRYFNDESLDLLRTSIQEVGVLVPLIVYEDPDDPENFVLMDGERRWTCALDLALGELPARVIEPPTPLDNLLQMFNIHNVREDWPLISVALSLKEVMDMSGETGEKRLSEMTGLTRSTVRRAKRLLSLPSEELELIMGEAHLDRHRQVHREDLYLEIESAASVIRNELPEVAEQFDEPTIIRQFARKAEEGELKSFTDFRNVAKLAKAADEDIVDRQTIVDATEELIRDPNLTPSTAFEGVAARAYRQHTLQRKCELIRRDLESLEEGEDLTEALRAELQELIATINELLEAAR